MNKQISWLCVSKSVKATFWYNLPTLIFIQDESSRHFENGQISLLENDGNFFMSNSFMSKKWSKENMQKVEMRSLVE